MEIEGKSDRQLLEQIVKQQLRTNSHLESEGGTASRILSRIEEQSKELVAINVRLVKVEQINNLLMFLTSTSWIALITVIVAAMWRMK